MTEDFTQMGLKHKNKTERSPQIEEGVVGISLTESLPASLEDTSSNICQKQRFSIVKYNCGGAWLAMKDG